MELVPGYYEDKGVRDTAYSELIKNFNKIKEQENS